MLNWLFNLFRSKDKKVDTPKPQLDILLSDKVKQLEPKARVQVLEAIDNNIKLFRKNKMLNQNILAMFFAQMAHESMGFRRLHEIPSKYSGKNFEKYDGRKSLGNTQPGDGKRFKGRGIIQLTGRWNYTDMSKKLGIDLVNNPKLASDPDVAVKVAVQYWTDKSLNKSALTGNIVSNTKKINGGLNGLSDRKRRYEKAKQIQWIG